MSYKVDRLDDFGRGITFVNNKICFVTNALEGEEVELEVVGEKSKYCEGKSTKIIKESKSREIVKCPYYDSCGGCNVSHMTYEEELLFKERKVKRILKKYAGLENVIKEIIKTDRNYYRNKVTLKVKDGHIGYFQNKSYDLVNIDYCYLCNEKINEVIKKLNNVDLFGINEVVIRCNYDNEILLYLIGTLEDEDSLVKELDDINNIVLNNYKSIRVLKGNSYLIDKIGDYSFRVSYNSFFQVNSRGVEILYNKVREYANLNGEETVLDLYCGTGTIGTYLSKHAKSVFGIEINKNAIEDANYNKEINNIENIDFLCEDISKIKNYYLGTEIVVVDPPRSGLSLEAIHNILEIKAKKIIYVSCEPMTLARDLNIIKEFYNVKEITLIDMFPNTYHCESVCVLERK